MSATKILWGQILTVFLIVLATTWGATEYVAWKLGFQAQLGPAWFSVLGWPFYLPPSFFWWWYSFDAYAPSIFVEGAFIAASGGFISIAVAIGMSVWRAREAKKVETYGSARWAEKKEVNDAGLLGPDGVVLGRYDHTYLRHDGPEHVLCFAPTRSGKGVGLVVPSLRRALKEAHFVLAHQLHYLLAHRLAQHVRIAQRVSSERGGNLHDLFLVEDHAVGGGEYWLQHLQWRARLVGVFAVGDVLRDHPCLHRPGAVQRV